MCSASSACMRRGVNNRLFDSVRQRKPLTYSPSLSGVNAAEGLRFFLLMVLIFHYYLGVIVSLEVKEVNAVFNR